MPEATRGNIGYAVAGFGGLIISVTLFLLHTGALPVTDGKYVLIMLIVVGAILIGMGMYVVVPKETHDAVTDFGGVARDIVPRFGGRRLDEPPPPQVVHPEAGQTTVVVPPTPAQTPPPMPPAPAPPITAPADPEVATGDALPLTMSGFRAPAGSRKEWKAPPAQVQKLRRAGAQQPVSDQVRNRQQAYPHDEA